MGFTDLKLVKKFIAGGAPPLSSSSATQRKCPLSPFPLPSPKPSRYQRLN